MVYVLQGVGNTRFTVDEMPWVLLSGSGQDLIEYTLLMAFVALASAALFSRPAPLVKGSYHMDEKDFKKHLANLVHGHHHPEEHDWSGETGPHKGREQADAKPRKPAKAAVRKRPARTKSA